MEIENGQNDKSCCVIGCNKECLIGNYCLQHFGTDSNNPLEKMASTAILPSHPIGESIPIFDNILSRMAILFSDLKISTFQHLIKHILDDNSQHDLFFDFFSSSTPPISQIAVILTNKKEECPPKFTIVKSVENKDGDLNKNAGGDYVFLAIKREYTSPITSASLVFAEEEEPPLTFTLISHTVGSRSACLNSGIFGIKPLYLSIYNGGSCPLNDIKIVYTKKKETVPPHYFSMSYSSEGRNTALGSEDNEVFLCFSLDYHYIFKLFLNIDEDYRCCKIFALLSISLFYPSCQLIKEAFYLSSILLQSLTPSSPLLNQFLSLVTDCGYLYIATLPAVTHSYLLQFLTNMIDLFHDKISTSTFFKMQQVCLLLRHQDRKDGCHLNLYNSLITHLSNTTNIQPIYPHSPSICLPVKTDEKFSPSTIISSLLNHIFSSKSLDASLSKFIRCSFTSKEFRDTILSLSSPFSHLASLFIIGFLSLSKQLIEPLSKNVTINSESVKRKSFILKNLLYILEKSAFIFQDQFPVLILRRFFFFSLIECCNTSISGLFRAIMSVFDCLYHNYYNHLMLEIGIFFDNVLLSLLDHEEVPLETLFISPQTIVNFYYNYDNGYHNWNIYEKIIILTEGIHLSSHPPEKIIPLRYRCCQFLVNLLGFLARCLHIGEGEVMTSSQLKVEDVSLENFEDYIKSKFSRSTTWCFRFDQQKEEKKIKQHAISLSHSDNLKAAMKYLVRIANYDPENIAYFLFHNEELDRAEVGEILGSDSDNCFDKNQYESLRLSYCQLLDFTNLSFDLALRHFLCNGGFRLPGEAQKVDRMVSAFSECFTNDNPGTFHSSSTAFVLAFAVIILNTDLHDQRLKNRYLHHMTEEQFIRNVRGIDDGQDLSETFLSSLYQSILHEPIEYRIEKTDYKEESLNTSNSNMNVFETILRKAQAALKTKYFQILHFYPTHSLEIAKAMFEVSWYRYISGISSIIDTVDDINILQSCIDGLKYGITICYTERNAFATILAKLIFIEENKNNINEENLHQAIIEGCHLQQDWFRLLRFQSHKNPQRAILSIHSLVNQAKNNIISLKNQSNLKQLSLDFSGDYLLFDKDRVFIREGPLIKISSSNIRQDYIFFLFSDLIIYASNQFQSHRYRIHRVLHLSLCRLVNIYDEKIPFAFRILSPQKNITVLAKNQNEKDSWLKDIHHSISETYSKRQNYFKSIEDLSRFSTFLSSSAELISDDVQQISPPPNKCKLCLRIFSYFRRKYLCPICNDEVCSDCSLKKSNIKDTKKFQKICDACYGVITGQIGDNIPILTIEENYDGAT